MKRLIRRCEYSPLSALLLLLALVVCVMPAGGQGLDSRSFDTEVREQQASRGARASAQAEGWVRIAPVGEEFTVMMPQKPRLYPDFTDTVSFEQSLRSYGSSEDNDMNMYIVTSSPRAKTAGVSVEAMLNPLAGEYEHPIFKDLRRRGYLTKVIEERDLMLKGYMGREYHLALSSVTRCITRVYVTHRRIYTLVQIKNYEPGAPQHRDQDRFLSTFMLGPINSDAAASNVYMGDEETYSMRPGIGPGCGGHGCAGTGQGVYSGGGGGSGNSSGLSDNDPNRVLSPREVTQKARILSKPQPQYTIEARQHNVSGTVVLRAVFGADGVMRNIRPVSSLPFGLTERAITAARQIRFVPAQKDGRPVSQFIVIEYNFNPY
jgi:TonB family protein